MAESLRAYVFSGVSIFELETAVPDNSHFADLLDMAGF
jgi:hypothetical protein